MANDDNSGSINLKDFLIGSFVGGVVGASTALLFAPKSGREIRQDIGDQTLTLKQKSSTLAQKAKDKSNDLAKTVSDQSSNVVNRVKEWQSTQYRDDLEEDTIEAETLRDLKSPQSVGDDEDETIEKEDV